MKKFFLIPVLALLTCVNAWGVDVATLAELQAALANGGNITLTADINAGATELVSAGTTTLDLNGQTLSGAKSNGESGVIKVTGGSLTINATNGGIISAGTRLNAICVKGGTLTINAGTFNGSYEAIYGTAGTININGGTFTTTYDNAVWAKGATLNISGGNFDGAWYDVQSDAGSVTRISGGTFAGDNDGTLAVGCYSPGPDLVVTGGTFNGTAGIGIWNGAPVIRGGSFVANPVSYVNLDSYIVTKPSTMYVVSALSADVVAYNITKSTTHTSLSDAIEAASNGNEIYLYKNDAAAISVSKTITIRTNGHTTNLSAGAGYARADMGQNIAFTDNAIAAFLMADGTNSMTIDANADISAAGAIHVNGDKTLTINAGVEVLYKRQGSLANIVVDEGAKLTVLGSGTFKPVMHSETNTINGFTAEISATAGNQIGNRVIDVDGELVVGVKNDDNNCPHFITSSIARGNAVMVNETGVATFNNADMKVASVSIKNYGNVTIHGGEYVSIATYQNGVNDGWFAYHLNNEGRMTVNGGHFVGVQGAFANATENAIVDIYGGYFETVNGHNWKTGAANSADNHYALYVATYSVVNVYGGYYKVTTPSAGGGKVALVGNNDAYNTYGIVNLYGGNFQRKVEVSPRKNKDSSYPASVPLTSAWYSHFGSEAPLPAGYEYYETGDATYPYGVRAIAGKETNEITSTEPTIPWQQTTTWSEGEVPETNTIVTLPAGKQVVVSKEEADKDAVADQIFINQNASLVVEEGTTLTVGEGGVNIAQGGSLMVKPNAVVKIGAAGVVTTNDEALVIESSETEQGVLVYDPNTDENSQPKATVRLYTKSKQLTASPYTYTWQRFAIPVMEITNDSKPTNDYTDQALFAGASTFKTYLYGWNGSDWTSVTDWTTMQPNKGYQIANNTANGGITYTFTGNLVGNHDGNYAFTADGFAFFGNSYTAPIYVPNLLQGFESQSGFEPTVHVYDITTDRFQTITSQTYQDLIDMGESIDDLLNEIESMQAFIIYGNNGSQAGLNYGDAIWGNPRINPTAPAPARKAASHRDLVRLTVAANGASDQLTLRQSNEFSSEFDNGADATKYMNQGTFNLYAHTDLGNLAQVSTDNLNQTLIGFQSSDAVEYTITCKQVGEEFILRDLMTGEEVVLNQSNTYTFAQQPNTEVEARFIILSGKAQMPTDMQTVEQQAKRAGIYTVMGQFIGQADQFNNLPAGVYVVDGVKVVK